MMNNRELFAEFSILVLKDLYDLFPIPNSLDKERHIGFTVGYPEPPIDSHFGIPGAGVYVGPDLAWVFDEEQQRKIWGSYNWDKCLESVQSLLQRALTSEETRRLLDYGVRPYTAEEKTKLEKWKMESDDYNESMDQYKSKEKVYLGSIQFLVNENYIRIKDIRKIDGKEAQNPDILIEQSFDRLQFILTSKGYIRLSKKPPLGPGSIYDGMKAYIKDKSVDAFAGAGASAILSALFGA